jgi:hypothetical protein
MPEGGKFKHIQVFCPECQKMISPGEYAMCPYFEGGELDISDAEQNESMLIEILKKVANH